MKGRGRRRRYSRLATGRRPATRAGRCGGRGGGRIRDASECDGQAQRVPPRLAHYIKIPSVGKAVTESAVGGSAIASLGRWLQADRRLMDRHGVVRPWILIEVSGQVRGSLSQRSSRRVIAA